MIREDIIMAFTVAFSYGALFLTRFAIGMTTSFAKTAENAEIIAKAVEANPIQAVILSLGNISLIINVIMIPAVLLSFYAYFRKKYKDDNREILTAITIIFMIVTSRDFVNDLGIVLGKLFGLI